MDDGRPDKLHPAAVPLLHRTFRQQIVVIVIARDESCVGRLGFQPVQPAAFPGAAIPYASEASTNDYIIVLGQLRLFVENLLLEPRKIRMGVVRDKNRHIAYPPTLF